MLNPSSKPIIIKPISSLSVFILFLSLIQMLFIERMVLDTASFPLAWSLTYVEAYFYQGAAPIDT